MNTLEAAVSGGKYLAGDSFTAADLYVGSQIGFGHDVRHHRKAAGLRTILAADQ